MINKDGIRQEEIDFPKRFASYEEKDYFKNNEDILAAHGFTYTPEEDHRIDAKKRLDIHISDYCNTRFDYIVTSKEHRGKGYAGELLSFVVEYCKENKSKLFSIWEKTNEADF